MPYIQPPVPQPFKPVDQYKGPCGPLDTCTIYNGSFCPPACPCQAIPIRQHDNIQVPNCKMEDQTIQKLSYSCHPCTKPPCPVLPCDRNFIGEGACSSMTTTRHDFIPKCSTKLNPIVPPTTLRNSCGVFEGCSVMQMSYQPPCQQDRQCSYKPIAVYSKPEHPFQNETVARLSYVPWPVKKKENYPWACKETRLFPPTPMESTSIYQSSYFAPGEYI